MFFLTTILIIILLIGANSIYVAAEFSTVSSRPARLHHYAEQGNQTAKTILGIIEKPHRLDAYIATCQVGITVSSLVLGYFGQSHLADYIAPLFLRFGIDSEAAALSISATAILIVLTIFQVLLGELVPKNIGLLHPERLSIFTYRIMRWSEIIFRPLIVLFNGSGFFIMRLFNLEPETEHAHIHSPEEIAILVEESRASGGISKEEHQLLRNTLLTWEAPVRQAMIPRTQMLIAPDSISGEELFCKLAESPFSRAPIYSESIDNIIGVIHIRELLCARYSENNQDIHQILHEAPFVPETLPIKSVFTLLQRKRFQVAIVLDEFGGVAGMVTLEDLLEQLFGELQDEFDREAPYFKVISEDRVQFRGSTLIIDVNRLFNLNLPDEDFDTIGGLLMNSIGKIPENNEIILIDGYRFKIEKMVKRSIALVSVALPIEKIRNLEKTTQS
jgi:putative hemolysin